MLLAIDTSSGSSAAVFLGDNLLAFENVADPFGHAENIGNVISAVLQKAEINPTQLTAIAIGRGPASYTGLRVGMAAGLTIAESLGVPSLGVSTLDALALAHSRNNEYVIATDAKRRQLFARAYRGITNDGLPYAISEPEVFEPAELSSRFTGFEVIQQQCSAKEIGYYAAAAIKAGVDLSDTGAMYLRSPDVMPSPGKKVSG